MSRHYLWTCLLSRLHRCKFFSSSPKVAFKIVLKNGYYFRLKASGIGKNFKKSHPRLTTSFAYECFFWFQGLGGECIFQCLNFWLLVESRRRILRNNVIKKPKVNYLSLEYSHACSCILMFDFFCVIEHVTWFCTLTHWEKLHCKWRSQKCLFLPCGLIDQYMVLVIWTEDVGHASVWASCNNIFHGIDDSCSSSIWLFSPYQSTWKSRLAD